MWFHWEAEKDIRLPELEVEGYLCLPKKTKSCYLAETTRSNFASNNPLQKALAVFTERENPDDFLGSRMLYLRVDLEKHRICC